MIAYLTSTTVQCPSLLPRMDSCSSITSPRFSLDFCKAATDSLIARDLHMGPGRQITKQAVALCFAYTISKGDICMDDSEAEEDFCTF